MSEEGQDRTEPASPRRREEARKQGQVAFSPDFVGSALLLGGVLGLTWFGPSMANQLSILTEESFRRPLPIDLDVADAATLLTRLFVRWVILIGPILGLLLAVSFGVSVAQVGFHVTPERLELDFEKLSPANGMGKLFSVAALVKGLLAIIKIAVLIALLWGVLRPRVGAFASLGSTDVFTASTMAWDLVLRLALYLAVGFTVIGVADYVYQRYRFEQSLRMTRQEVREEVKREEGDPHIKARIRQVLRETSQRRMLGQVPRATVVVTNPTHYAVALRYERRVMRAPVVIARGAGVLARRIIERAREYGVPVLERPALARALYQSVEVDREIPAELFVALAEVIAFVFRLRGLDKG